MRVRALQEFCTFCFHNLHRFLHYPLSNKSLRPSFEYILTQIAHHRYFGLTERLKKGAPPPRSRPFSHLMLHAILFCPAFAPPKPPNKVPTSDLATKTLDFFPKTLDFFQSISEVSLEGTHCPIFFAEMMNPHHPIHPPKSSLKRHSATRHWKDIYGQFSYFSSFFAIQAPSCTPLIGLSHEHRSYYPLNSLSPVEIPAIL